MELTPERQAQAEQYRQTISMYIAGRLTAQAVEKPQMYIGYEDNEVIS